MVQIAFAARTVQPDAATTSRITDLDLVRIGGQERLVSTTRQDGELALWNVNGLRPALLDDSALAGPLAAGQEVHLAAVTLGGTAMLLSGGGAGGALRLTGFQGDGDFGATVTLAGTAGAAGAMQDMVAVALGTGGVAVWGARAGGDGLVGLSLAAGGTVAGQFAVDDTPGVALGAVSDLAQMQVGPHAMLFAASASEHAVTAFFVNAAGALVTGATIGMDDGLWIAVPTALATARVAGQDFLLVGSAGSNSLSVIRVDAAGGLHVTDHQLDTLATRFGQVQAVETIAIDGRTYVVSGGGDDGVAVHALLPGGQLLHLASFADTFATDLQNVAALALRKTGTGFDIYASSTVETGITRLSVDLSDVGAIRLGGAGSQTLSGTARDDVIGDGAGADTLTGGAGADVFVLAWDGAADTITDFTPGEDRLDLSGWPMVRDIGQLTLTATAWGMRVSYGDEVLDVRSADGGPIDHRLLTTADLVQGARIPQVILPGHPGPWTPAPALPGGYVPASGDSDWTLPEITIGGQTFRNPQTGRAERSLKGDDRANVLTGDNRRELIAAEGGDDRVTGRSGDDRILGGAGHDTLDGGQGDDRLEGGTGADVLRGGGAEDALFGHVGADRIHGGAQDDMLFGGAGRDLLWGDDGNDRLSGGSDAGSLWGGAGHDRLTGGTQDDRLAGNGGRDVLKGEDGADRLLGGGGEDRLWGGDGADRIWGDGQSDILAGGADADRLWGGGQGDSLSGENGDDRLFGGSGDDRLGGGSGNDWLEGAAGRDILAGGSGADTLKGGAEGDRLAGGDGADRLTGGAGDDDLFGGVGVDRLAGGAGNDLLEGDAGDDSLFGGTGDDRLAGGTGRDLLEGGEGGDRLEGGEAADRLAGQAGDDRLAGDGGDDSLFGGDGADRLAGGAGNDLLTGGAGADVFHFDDGDDRIADFAQGEDLVEIAYDLFPGRLTGAEVWLFYGAMQDATTAVLDFGFDRLVIAGVTDAATLADSFLVV